jgi:chemotaxis protein histidine kinase CheA
VSDKNSGQMTQTPNLLRPKLGVGRLGALDPAAIAKAEAALKSLSGNFSQWLHDEIAKLEAARLALRTDGVSAQTMEALYLRAHDLKGLGTTYGFPLITRVAASLCVLTDDVEKRANAPMSLVDAHIDAIRAAVAQDIKSDEHPVGRALAETLEAQVAACVRD